MLTQDSPCSEGVATYHQAPETSSSLDIIFCPFFFELEPEEKCDIPDSAHPDRFDQTGIFLHELVSIRGTNYKVTNAGSKYLSYS